MPSRMKD